MTAARRGLEHAVRRISSGTRLADAALLCLLACSVSVGAAPAGAATRPLALGFFDPIYTEAPALSGPWLQRSVDAGSDIVKFDAGWPAARRPARPRDPADPAYDFTRTDGAVRAAAARGLQILLVFSKAPSWAEGPGRPASAGAGTWRPDPTAVGDYGAALARRYSGAFADPLRPGFALPRVKALQLWNEPNLALYLRPQWSGRRALSPEIYRAMLNAFYAGVKSVSGSMLVVTAGTGPFGDPGTGGKRMMPARFWRGVLCQTEVRGKLRGVRCPRPARFDVLAHHPYPGGPPRWKELYRDDVSVDGMAKLTRILAAAERTGRALPRKRHQVWVTEVSYDSSPPDPAGVPLARHARWLQETLYLLWRRGVSTIVWFRIVDQLPVPSYGDTNQSGLYRVTGAVKPAARAFRFPFVAERGAGNRRAVTVWGRSPVAGRVTIERSVGGRWVALRSVSVRRHGTFLVRLSLRAGANRLRARVGSERSLVWQVS